MRLQDTEWLRSPNHELAYIKRRSSGLEPRDSILFASMTVLRPSRPYLHTACPVAGPQAGRAHLLLRHDDPVGHGE